jgi:hypothetical protein
MNNKAFCFNEFLEPVDKFILIGGEQMREVGEMFQQDIPDKFVLKFQVFAVINKGTG